MTATPPPKAASPALPFALASAVGFGTCLAITLATGRREAWDAGAYFSVGIPVMCALVFAIARAFPEKAWRWAAGVAFGQSIAMLASGNSLSLWPLSLIAMTVLSLPQLAAAMLGAALARRRAR